MKSMYASACNASRTVAHACIWPAARHANGEIAYIRAEDGRLTVLLRKLTIGANPSAGLEAVHRQKRQKQCCVVRAAEDNKAGQGDDKSIEMLERRSRRRKSSAAPTKQREPQVSSCHLLLPPLSVCHNAPSSQTAPSQS